MLYANSDNSGFGPDQGYTRLKSILVYLVATKKEYLDYRNYISADSNNNSSRAPNSWGLSNNLQSTPAS